MLAQDLRVTTPARTVVDVCRHEPLPWGVAVGDAARRQGVRLEELEEQLARASRRPGLKRARLVVAFLDGRSESPGESISRWLMREARLPLPDLQAEVETATGKVRVDFLWEELGLIGEFDGMVKYGVELAGPDPTVALASEKRREDSLRAQGYIVVRWLWDDLWVQGKVAAMVRSGFATAARSRTRLSA